MGIYPARGVEHMFQLNAIFPMHFMQLITREGCYTPKYFAETNRLLVIPMERTDSRLLQSNWYKQRKDSFNFPTNSHCKRLGDDVDIVLTDEEKALIEGIANIDGIQQYVEYAGWYDNCYVSCTLDKDISEDNPHKIVPRSATTDASC
jgi:hypothetical protein